MLVESRIPNLCEQLQWDILHIHVDLQVLLELFSIPDNLLYFSHVVVTSSLTWLCWLLVCWKTLLAELVPDLLCKIWRN